MSISPATAITLTPGRYWELNVSDGTAADLRRALGG